jgi:Lon protease-like protein
MQDALLPLFPLEVVLLPGNRLPLHIFEERYKEMIGEAMRDGTEFGMVQSKENGVLNLGCTATVEAVLKQYPDGRLDIVIVGRRRFEILFLDQEKAYLRGGVTFFGDDKDQPAPSEEARLAALALFDILRRQEDDPQRPLPDKMDPQLSFAVAQHVPVLSLRQTLLALRSEAERLQLLEQFLPSYIAGLKRTEHVKKVAPKNGHGFIELGKDKDT